MKIEGTIKTILVFPLIHFCLLVDSQEFQFNLYFEDANGNQDTLIYGFDTDATAGIDTLFGEKDIYQEEWIDSFEVRIFNDFWYYFNHEEDRFATKKQITAKPCTDTNFPHVSLLGLKNTNYPLKVHWDSSKFNIACVKNTLITDWHPGCWFDCVMGGEQGPFFFFEHDTCVFFHTTTNDVDPVNGKMDLLYFTLASSTQVISGIEEIEDHNKLLKVYPNPAVNSFYIQMNDNRQYTLIMFDLVGNKLLQMDNPTEVDLTYITSGTYILMFKFEASIEVKPLVVCKR